MLVEWISMQTVDRLRTCGIPVEGFCGAKAWGQKLAGLLKEPWPYPALTACINAALSPIGHLLEGWSTCLDGGCQPSRLCGRLML